MKTNSESETVKLCHNLQVSWGKVETQIAYFFSYCVLSFVHSGLSSADDDASWCSRYDRGEVEDEAVGASTSMLRTGNLFGRL